MEPPNIGDWVRVKANTSIYGGLCGKVTEQSGRVPTRWRVLIPGKSCDFRDEHGLEELDPLTQALLEKNHGQR